MQLNFFPEKQKDIFEEEKKETIDLEQQKSNEMIRSIRAASPRELDGGDAGVAFMAGGILGLVIGLFICMNMESAGSAFLTWITCGIIGGILGVVIVKAVNGERREQIKMHSQMQQDESDKLQRKISKINDVYQKKFEDYVKSFELTAKQESVKFAESRLAKEVIDWMTDGFSKTINSVDRRSHIQRINVPFAFSVYENKITCNLGIYDFEVKRCRNLTSPIEQTALAIAIASAIQVNIVMKYPKDASGTDISINIDYSYNAECPIATITYVAPNGNYKAVEEW